MTFTGTVTTFQIVDNEEARRRLPETHAQALRLRDQGLTEESIAEFLSIPLAAVRPLLNIAEAKLARLLTEESEEPGPSMKPPKSR
jgi:DNA-directed RNA polymerase specialized sigma24 family protein